MNKGYLLSTEEIRALHEKYAPNATVLKLVWTHCCIVGDIALQLAQQPNIDVDIDLVRVGCLVHDIGVYSLYDDNGFESNPKKYITHGIRGEEILKNEGFPEVLYRFASHHTGAGLSKKQIIETDLPLPYKDFLAETPEEELVMYADKFHSKSKPPCFNSHEYYANYSARFGEEAREGFAYLTDKFGKPRLEPFIERYGYQLR